MSAETPKVIDLMAALKESLAKQDIRPRMASTGEPAVPDFVPAWGVMPAYLKPNRVNLFVSESGDWAEAWVDGQKVHEGHEHWSPMLEAIVTALGAGRIVVTEIADD